MAKHYDPRTLLRLIAVPLMHEFFRQRGELLELPWHELAERRQTLPIYDAWQSLPDDRRRQVQSILQDLLALADNRGMKVFAEEVQIHAPDRSWEFVSCRTRLNKAMWFLLNFPELFDRAALFARADALAVGRYAIRYTGLPQTPIAVTSETKQALQRALRSYYWPHEMRGHHCHVEHYTRSGGNEYFFAYLDDWPDTRLVFEDNGDLAPRSELYAFSILFVYSHGAPSIDSRTTLPFCTTLRTASSTIRCSISTSFVVRSTTPGSANPTCPSLANSWSVNRTAALARNGLLRSMPSRAASSSAVLKPIPRMSSANWYGFSLILAIASCP